MGSLLLDQDWSRQPDDEHRAAWKYLSDHAFEYPNGLDVPAMRPTKESRKGPVFYGLDVVMGENTHRNPSDVSGCVVADGPRAFIVDDGEQDDFPDRLAAQLFSHGRRGVAYVVRDGARSGLHAIFRRCHRAWLRAGYTISPVVAGTAIKALTIRRAKHSWHLVDFLSLVGLEDQDSGSALDTFAGPGLDGQSDAVRVGIAAGHFAQLCEEQFGVRARLTAGRTAVAGVSRHLPDDGWLWRPTALAVTLSRVGGGFRGGYCFYPSYRGPGHKIDIRRAYTWALAEELPNGSAYGACHANGIERPGLYVCRLRGPGYVPVYVAPFGGAVDGFRRRLWNGDSCVCCLHSAEFPGLRALGYRVEPGFGCVWTSSVRLDRFVCQVERVTAAFGPDSPQGLVCKALANRVYGKMAEAPSRTEVVFSVEQPTDEHLPFLDAKGDEVDDAWNVERTNYRSHQHVDVAGVVTALVRSRLYTAMGRLDEAGIGTLAADTDGLVCTHHPAGVLQLDGGRFGGWRYCGYDPDIVISGPRFAVIAGRTLTAGTSPQSPEVVALAYDRGTVTVEGKVMAPPWREGPSVTIVSRTLRRGLA